MVNWKHSSKTFTLETDGFEGEWYPAVSTNHPNNKVLIAVGGLKDRRLLHSISNYFNDKGIDIVTLYFYGGGKLHMNQNLIPVEYVEAAIQRLKKINYHHFGITGLSKGAEYALLSASKLPDIELALAFSPSHCVWEGEISAEGIWKTRESGEAGFSWRDLPLPFENYSFSTWKMLKASLKNREMTCANVFEDAIEFSDNQADIIVEDIAGDIFLFSSEHDSVFPSKIAGDKIVKRLKNHGFKYFYKNYTYKYASHVLLPFYVKGQKLVFKLERNFSKECRQMRIELDTDIEHALNMWKEKSVSTNKNNVGKSIR